MINIDSGRYKGCTAFIISETNLWCVVKIVVAVKRWQENNIITISRKEYEA